MDKYSKLNKKTIEVKSDVYSNFTDVFKNSMKWITNNILVEEIKVIKITDKSITYNVLYRTLIDTYKEKDIKVSVIDRKCYSINSNKELMNIIDNNRNIGIFINKISDNTATSSIYEVITIK